MQAILSDIHANLEALNAVLADMSQFSVNVVRCLGDTVGYGPNPRECLDLVRRFDTVLRGELDDLVDRGLARDIPQNVRKWAAEHHRMIEWAGQAELRHSPDPSGDASDRAQFLAMRSACSQATPKVSFCLSTAVQPIHYAITCFQRMSITVVR